ncbi:sensor histidine kinase [Chitinophaga rhizophila]|uniref:Histidine kinase/HSP90-like ATPase domain-containing protein n=1 Tax=Chitinophaga rhizophila TaxID=2866212 RepID=A0ABS7G7W6_9BACT|nr:hypothetical protein [Chitinophaga rhizophila]MBW8683225.1 hypothetical protein [Chitinophaga rhizophila]
MREDLFMRIIPSAPVISEPGFLLSLRVAWPWNTCLTISGILPVACWSIVAIWIVSIIKRPDVYGKRQHELLFKLKQRQVMVPVQQVNIQEAERKRIAAGATIRMRYYPDYPEMLVEDDGVKLPPTTARPSGIGLSGVHTCLKSMGGHLHIDSGISGTTFIIQIPVIPQHAANP